jgi:glycosyltransferase involved in cell wall biosynthesis
MKQLVVAGSFPFTSQTFVTREVASTLKAGHDVHVLAPTRGDAMGEEFCARVGFPLERVIYRNYMRYPVLTADLGRFSSGMIEAGMRKVYGRVIAERRKSYFCDLLKDPRIRGADLIHAHFVGWGYMVAVPLARLLGVPVTVTAHEVELPDVAPESLRYVQEYADIITIVSSEYRRHWINLTGREDKLRVVHNGVDLAEFGPVKAAGPSSGAIRLVTVSRLVPHKRVQDGIRAVRRLLDRGINVEYDIVSDGPERAKLEALRSELRLDSHVRFLGFLPRAEVVAAIMASDILLHPSEAEGFGIAVVEGMAAGLPVVVARSGGVRDIVDHGRFGFLYEPGDVDALAEYAARLVASREERAAFGAAARRAAETRFAWEPHMAEMYRVWNEALDGQGQRARVRATSD